MHGNMRKSTLRTRWHDVRRLLVRYVKYMGTSVIGTLTDTLVLWLLSDFVFTEGYWGEYVVSPVLSFQSAVLVNYTISYFYVWKDRVSNRRGVRTYLRLYLIYNISCTSIFLIRLGLLLLIEKLTGWDVVVCNLSAMAVTGIMNFLLTNNVIFRKR